MKIMTPDIKAMKFRQQVLKINENLLDSQDISKSKKNLKKFLVYKSSHNLFSFSYEDLIDSIYDFLNQNRDLIQKEIIIIKLDRVLEVEVNYGKFKGTVLEKAGYPPAIWIEFENEDQKLLYLLNIGDKDIKFI